MCPAVVALYNLMCKWQVYDSCARLQQRKQSSRRESTVRVIYLHQYANKLWPGELDHL